VGREPKSAHRLNDLCTPTGTAPAHFVVRPESRLDYGGMWVTGANTCDPSVNTALGFQAPGRMVGFRAVGTPKATMPAEQLERRAHVVERGGPLPAGTGARPPT
jgi:hypothetical protein